MRSATAEKFSRTSIHTQYVLVNGKKVPGVTTVLGILAKPALIHWAWKLGVDGVDYRKHRDAAADVGTLAHELIAADLGGRKPDLTGYSPETIDRAENAVISYLEWKKDKKIQPVLVEEPLVSERHQYGGTLDCLAIIDGTLTLLDIKTSKAIYPEMLYQLGAYWQLLKEHGYQVDAAQILRVGRDEIEGFDVKKITNFIAYWQVFYHCLQIYYLRKEVE